MSTTSWLKKAEQASGGDIGRALAYLDGFEDPEARVCAVRVLRIRQSRRPDMTKFRVERSGFVRVIETPRTCRCGHLFAGHGEEERPVTYRLSGPGIFGIPMDGSLRTTTRKFRPCNATGCDCSDYRYEVPA